MRRSNVGFTKKTLRHVSRHIFCVTRWLKATARAAMIGIKDWGFNRQVTDQFAKGPVANDSSAVAPIARIRGLCAHLNPKGLRRGRRRPPNPDPGLIACGALAQEIRGGAAAEPLGTAAQLEVTCLPAIWHNTPGTRSRTACAPKINWRQEALRPASSCSMAIAAPAACSDEVLKEEGSNGSTGRIATSSSPGTRRLRPDDGRGAGHLLPDRLHRPPFRPADLARHGPRSPSGIARCLISAITSRCRLSWHRSTIRR